MVKRLGRHKASKIFPFDGEMTTKDEMKEMLERMNEDIAFQPGVVYVPGKGFIHKDKINANGNGT